MKKSRVATVLLAAVLCLVMTVPMVAVASPKAKAHHAVAIAATVHRSARRVAHVTATSNLEHRVTMAVRNRGIRFENAARAIERNQQRLSDAIAQVEAAGADCTQARALLEQSKASVVTARQTEAAAAATLQTIPGSSDARGTFRLGREQAREAVAQLKQARTELHSAIRALRVVINGLVSAGSDETTATQGD